MIHPVDEKRHIAMVALWRHPVSVYPRFQWTRNNSRRRLSLLHARQVGFKEGGA